MRKPMRWRYEPGGYNSASYRLRRAGVDIAIVAPSRQGGWYSYGLNLPGGSWNTSAAPCELEVAKADAVARARAALNEARDAE